MVWEFLWKYLKKAKWLGFAFMGFFVFAAFLMRLQHYFAAQMIGIISEADKYPDLAWRLTQYLLYLVVVFGLSDVADYVRRRIEIKFITYSLLQVSKDLFVMVHKHSMRFFEEELSGNISGKVNNILKGIENIYTNIVFGFCQPFIDIVLSLAFIAVANVYLALWLGIMNAVFLFVTVYFRKKQVLFSAKKSKLSAEANGIFIDGVTNAHLVKSFSNYFYEKQLYYQAAHKAANARYVEIKRDVFTRFLSAFIFDSMIICSYVLIFYFCYHYNLSVADVVLTTSLMMSLRRAFLNMGYCAGNFAGEYGSVQDGLELLSTPCDVVDKPNAKKMKLKSNTILFDNIKFSYNHKKLFNNFKLVIDKNKKIGLVGYSGSGKSTLIKLLLRYYDLQGGKILIDGQDISLVTQETLRRNIAIIPQESTLFNRTIMENIRYGNPKATDKQVILAAKKAYIHDFIMLLPDGYNSKVGERGIMLSGGQRQRISIARAILKNAPILILDEATSALDSKSERYIQQSIKSLMKNKTVIAIAHRLSTLHDMDEIVVMSKGKIVEHGTHDDLLKQNGQYTKLYSMQSEGFLGKM